MIQQETLPGCRPGLRAYVLVLNRLWRAIRVIEAKRAFGLICREAAQVIRVDDGSYSAYDFESWVSLGLPVQRLDINRNGGSPLAVNDYDWVQSVRFKVAVPKVVRLMIYDRFPSQDMKLTRRNIFARDRHRCQYCHRQFPGSQLSVDHVVPRSQGGPSTWENLVCCCMGCNSRKGGRTPDQAKMRLADRPVKPKYHFMIESGANPSLHSNWRVFLDR